MSQVAIAARIVASNHDKNDKFVKAPRSLAARFSKGGRLAMTLFTQEKRGETIALLGCLNHVFAPRDITSGDILVSFRVLELDTDDAVRVDALTTSEACFFEVMSKEVDAASGLVFMIRKVGETDGYLDAEGSFAFASALSVKGEDLEVTAVGGAGPSVLKLAATGVLRDRISDLVSELQARSAVVTERTSAEVETLVGGEEGLLPSSTAPAPPGMALKPPVVPSSSVVVTAAGFISSLDGDMVPCPGKMVQQMLWVKETTFARRTSDPERFQTISSSLILEWDGDLWLDFLKVRKSSGLAACQGVWSSLHLAPSVLSFSIAGAPAVLKRFAEGRVDGDYKNLSLAHFRYARMSNVHGVGGVFASSTAPVATTVLDLRELEAWLANLEITLTYLCGNHFRCVMDAARVLLFADDINPLLDTTPCYLRELLEKQFRFWTFAVRTMKVVEGVDFKNYRDVAAWLGRLMSAALDPKTISPYPHNLWYSSAHGYCMLSNTGFGAPPPTPADRSAGSSGGKKRKVTAATGSAASDEDEDEVDSSACAFRVFELARIKWPGSQDIVKCTRPKCNFCKNRTIKTLASVTRAEAQAIIDKYKSSKEFKDKTLADRLGKQMSTIGWKK